MPHRDEPNAVMRPVINQANQSFTKPECSQIRQLGFFDLVADRSANPLSRLPITDFVTQAFTHGVPYAEARQYGSADLDQIIPWLSQSSRAEYWSNVVSVIGIVADSRSSQLLRGHIGRQATGVISLNDYRSRSDAIISLGYVVYGNGDGDARNFLEQHKIPSAWSSTGWRAPYHANDDERNADLAAAAILGLGLIADAQAKQALTDARQAIRSGSTMTGGSLESVIDEALKAAEIISDSGMVAYKQR
ncbi:hypothetical protein ACVMFA_002206 [Bradyrhizobium liaoningense]